MMKSILGGLLAAVAVAAVADPVDDYAAGGNVHLDLLHLTYTYDGFLSGSGSGEILDSEAPATSVAKANGTLNYSINARDLGLPFDITIPLTGTKVGPNEIRWDTNTLVNQCITVTFQGTETQMLIKRVIARLGVSAVNRNPFFDPVTGRGVNVACEDIGGDAKNFIDVETYLFCSENSLTRVDFRIRGIDYVQFAGVARGEILPTQVDATRGVLRSGGLAEVLASDDAKFIVDQRPQFSPALANAEATVTGTCAAQTVGSLVLNVEVASNGLPGSSVLQRVQAFNYSTGLWDLIDERNPSMADQVLTLAVANPNQYIEAGTRQMRARVGWYDRGTLAPAWFGATDRLTWTIAP